MNYSAAIVTLSIFATSCIDPLPLDAVAVPHLSFEMLWGENETYDRLWIPKQRHLPLAHLTSADGTNLQLLLAPNEHADLFALFTTETLISTYLSDSDKNAPDYVGTLEKSDCTREDKPTQMICQALEIARVHASGGPVLVWPHGTPKFILQGPTQLSIDTARMLIALNDLRIRIRETGQTIDPGNNN